MIGYGLIIIAIIITLASQGYIKSMYNKTRKISVKSNMTGREVARKILDENGLNDVDVIKVNGVMTDHYDPRSKVVRLSTEVYENDSIASVSIAAHECGHAIQDSVGYTFLRFRNSIVPLVNFASRAGYVIIMIGLLTTLVKLLWVGIILELVILLFQLITLPVEFNASNRGLEQINKISIVDSSELNKCKKMLKAAALTYVASVAVAILDILRLVLIAIRRD